MTLKQPVVLCLLLTACVGPIDPSDGGIDAGVVWPEGTLELGTEDAGAFSTFPAQVQATPGAQGGYHVAVMYRVTDQAVPGVTFDHRVTRKRDNVLVSKGSRTLSVDPVAAGQSWFTPGPVIIFICPTPVGVSAIDEELHFEVTASKSGLVLGKAGVDSRFGCPPGDGFCASICAG
jgi:hypothetical protein